MKLQELLLSAAIGALLASSPAFAQSATTQAGNQADPRAAQDAAAAHDADAQAGKAGKKPDKPAANKPGKRAAANDSSDQAAQPEEEEEERRGRRPS